MQPVHLGCSLRTAPAATFEYGCTLVGDASSQSQHSLQSLHRSQVLASMSEHFQDSDAVGIVRETVLPQNYHPRRWLVSDSAAFGTHTQGSPSCFTSSSP